jgi:hypothetical protein
MIEGRHIGEDTDQQEPTTTNEKIPVNEDTDEKNKDTAKTEETEPSTNTATSNKNTIGETRQDRIYIGITVFISVFRSQQNENEKKNEKIIKMTEKEGYKLLKRAINTKLSQDRNTMGKNEVSS